jgi:hypothetical protein
MSEEDPPAYWDKRRRLAELAGFEIDIDEYLAISIVEAEKVELTFPEYVRRYFEDWDEKIESLPSDNPLHEFHRELDHEIRVQDLLRDSGYETKEDPLSLRDLALVFGYWASGLADHMIDLSDDEGNL